jgi:hypothetical protein
MDNVEQAWRDVANIPVAVSGNGGDWQTYMVGFRLVHEFQLDWDNAWEILLDYNQRCRPPWSEADLERKLDHAFQRDGSPASATGISAHRRPPVGPRSVHQSTARPAHHEVPEIALAKKETKQIVTEYPMPVDSWKKHSPVAMPTDPSEAWKLWLRLFDPGDVIWIGDRNNSGSEACSCHFRTVEHWLDRPWSTRRNSPIPIQSWGQLTCPAVFKPGSYSRCKANILQQPYIVLESDTLSKDKSGGLFRWLDKNDILRLRCVVDSGNKSLHGWFEMPPAKHIPILKKVLTVLGCDRSMFSPSQPVRLPGGWRDADRQRPQPVLYLDV